MIGRALVEPRTSLPIDASLVSVSTGPRSTSDPSEWPAAYGAALLATGRLLIGNDAEAHDLVQRTYELGIRNLASLRDVRHVKSWLLAIEAREAFRVGRRLRRLVSLDASVSSLDPSQEPDPELLALRAALRKLPDRTRAAIVLHYMAGLSVEETAGAMGSQPNTVKTQLRLGLQKLREALDARRR